MIGKTCEHHVSKTHEGIYSVLVTDVFGLIIGVLIRFWDQKVKVQGHSRQRHNRRWKSVQFQLVLHNWLYQQWSYLSDFVVSHCRWFVCVTAGSQTLLLRDGVDWHVGAGQRGNWSGPWGRWSSSLINIIHYIMCAWWGVAGSSAATCWWVCHIAAKSWWWTGRR